jgi:beta-galactosidase
VVKTAGASAKLSAKADRSTIAADGLGLAFITVAIVNKDGVFAPSAQNRVRFSIDSPGEIVATDNGDPMGLEAFPSKERNAFNGLCLAIVRAKPRQEGTITVKIESEGLADAMVTIRSRTQ